MSCKSETLIKLVRVTSEKNSDDFLLLQHPISQMSTTFVHLHRKAKAKKFYVTLNAQ